MKPKEIKENDFEAYVDLEIAKYPEYYKNRYLLIEKTEGKIKFFEIYDGIKFETYELPLDIIEWLIKNKRIRNKRIKLVLKLAENEKVN